MKAGVRGRLPLIAAAAVVALMALWFAVGDYPGPFGSCDFEPGRRAAVDAWHEHWLPVIAVGGPVVLLLLLAGTGRRFGPAVVGAAALVAVAVAVAGFAADGASGLLGGPFVLAWVLGLPWLLLGVALDEWAALAAGLALIAMLSGAWSARPAAALPPAALAATVFTALCALLAGSHASTLAFAC
jgi:hypothetical protein